jgi:DHA3 family tetracycline resistance protein-like MFS transporter
MRRPSPYRFYLFIEAALSIPSFVVIAIYFVQQVGLTPLQLVLVGSVMELTVFVFQVPTGIVADLYGRKLSIVIACAIMGPGTILVGAVPEFWAALVGWALWGFGVTFMSGAWEAWITDEVGAENVGPVFVRGMQVAYIGALVGLPLWIGLATISLQGTVIADGVMTLVFGLIAVPLMPETAFRPRHRGRGAGRRTAREGAALVRRRPLVLLLVVTAFFAGAYSEGLDRLWEAHFIRDVGLPSFLGLSDLWWFVVVSGGAMLLGLLVSSVLLGRLANASDRAMARLLLVLTALQILTVVAFGLASGFVFALLAFWGAGTARRLANPVEMTWLNQSIGDSSVRATVISIAGQSDAVGQVAGGPGIGAVGNAFGIRAALVAAGLVLTPALGLYSRALRHGGHEPELADLPVAAEV